MSTLTLGVLAAPAHAQATATMRVSAQVLQAAVPASALDTAVTTAVSHALAAPSRVLRRDDLPGTLLVVRIVGAAPRAGEASPAPGGDIRSEVRLEYVAS